METKKRKVRDSDNDAESTPTEGTSCWIIRSRCHVDHFRHFFTASTSRSRCKIQTISLRPCHIDIIKGTPFHNFINLPDLPVARGLLSSIFERWDEGQQFIVNDVTISFKSSDVALLLGLPDFGAKIYLSSGASGRMFEKYFSEVKPTRSKLENLMRKLHKRNSEVDKNDFCRLYILYIFACILFCRTNYGIDEALIDIVDDLTKLNSYNWAEAIHSFMVDSINSVGDRVKRIITQQEKTDVGYLRGYVPLLMGWFCEYVPFVEPMGGVNGPRLWKWKISRQRQQTINGMISQLSKSDIREQLRPLPSEEWLIPKLCAPSKETIGVEGPSTSQCLDCDKYKGLIDKFVEVLSEKGLQHHVKDIMGDGYQFTSPIAINVAMSSPQQRSFFFAKDMLAQQRRYVIHRRSPCLFRDTTKNQKNYAAVLRRQWQRSKAEKKKIGARIEGKKYEGEVVNKEEVHDKREEEENDNEESKIIGEDDKEENKEEHEKEKLDHGEKHVENDMICVEMDMMEEKNKREQADAMNFDKRKAIVLSLYKNEVKINRDSARILHAISSLSFVPDVPFWSCGQIFCEPHGFFTLLDFKNFTFGEMIDVYSTILAQKAQSSSMPYKRSIFMLTMFEEYFASLRRLRAKCSQTNIEGPMEYIFVPLHSNAHWHLLVVDLRKKHFMHYNSMGIRQSGHNRTFEKAIKTLKDLTIEDLENIDIGLPKILHTSGWKETNKRCPTQEESLDCAIFVMKFMEYILFDKRINFSQKDMKRFRLEIAENIIYDDHCQFKVKQ